MADTCQTQVGFYGISIETTKYTVWYNTMDISTQSLVIRKYDKRPTAKVLKY